MFQVARTRSLLFASLSILIMLPDFASADGESCQLVFDSTSRPAAVSPARQNRPARNPKMSKVEALLAEAEERARQMAGLNQVNELESSIQRNSRSNGEIERQTDFAARQRMNELRSLLLMGELGAATDRYRIDFRNVELNYYVIQSNKDFIATLQGEIISLRTEMRRNIVTSRDGEAQIAKLLVKITEFEKVNEALLKQFGESYGAYIEVRDFLESVIREGTVQDINVALNSGQDGFGSQDGQGSTALSEDHEYTADARKAQVVLRRLGSAAMQGYMDIFGVPKARPAVRDIKALFRTEMTALTAKLAKDAKAEAWAKWRRILISYQLLEKARMMAMRLPSPLRDYALVVLGVTYDGYVARYFSDVDLVVRVHRGELTSQGAEDSRGADMLRDVVDKRTRSEGREYLFTFARLKEYRGAWIEIREQTRKLAELGGDNWPYQVLYDKMMTAENKIKEEAAKGRINELSIMNPPPRTDALGRVALVTALAAYTLYQNPEMVQPALDAVNAILGGLVNACGATEVAAENYLGFSSDLCVEAGN